MENGDKDELARQLAKMKRELRQKERKLKRYNKALEAKKHVQETIKRQNTQMSSHGEESSREPSEGSSTKEPKNATSRIVTFSKDDPEVIYTSPVGAGLGKKNPKGRRKGKKENTAGDNREMQKDLHFVEKEDSDLLGINNIFSDEYHEINVDGIESDKFGEYKEECNLNAKSGDIFSSSAALEYPDAVCDLNSNQVFDENEAMQHLSIREQHSNNAQPISNASLKDCDSSVPANRNNVCEMSEIDRSTNLDKIHKVSDTEIKERIVTNKKVKSMVLESQDLFETQFNCENIDMRRRCKSSVELTMRRLTESWSGESSKEASAEITKTGLRSNHSSGTICEPKTPKSDPYFKKEENAIPDVLSASPVVKMQSDDKERRTSIQNSDIKEMFETSHEMDELEEEMMDAVRSAEEDIMKVEETCQKNESYCHNMTTSDTSMIESQGKYKELEISQLEDEEFLESFQHASEGQDSKACLDHTSQLQHQNETSGAKKSVYPDCLTSEKFGKVFSASIATKAEKSSKGVQVLLVHEGGFTLWDMATEECVANGSRRNPHSKSSSPKWFCVKEMEFEVGTETEIRNLAVVGLPSEEEANFLVVRERIMEEYLTLIYIQSFSSTIVAATSIPAVCKTCEGLLCCYLGEWSIITYWKPEEAEDNRSLLVADFDVAFSRRKKKWELQCNTSLSFTPFEEDLTSLTPINNTGSEGIVLCGTSNDIYIYDALHEVTLVRHPWHLPVICWAISLKELLFVMTVQEKEAQIHAINPLNGESEIFGSWNIEENEERLNTCGEQERTVVTGISSSSQGITIAWKRGAVACIPLKTK